MKHCLSSSLNEQFNIRELKNRKIIFNNHTNHSESFLVSPKKNDYIFYSAAESPKRDSDVNFIEIYFCNSVFLRKYGNKIVSLSVKKR